MTKQLQIDFKAELGSLSEVDTNVDEIYAIIIPTDADLPAMTYTFQGGGAETFYQGSFGLTDYTVDINVFSRSYETLVDVADAVVDHFNGFTGELNSSTAVQRIFVENVLSGIEVTDPGVYRSTISLSITT